MTTDDATAASAATPSPTASSPDTVSSYAATDRTALTRARERGSYDRESVHAILDDGYLCHLGFVRDGAPVVLPTLYARVDERLYLHGSTGAAALRAAGAADPGMPVCVTVTHVDGIVLARSAFHHSLNYRSVVVHGLAHAVRDQEERKDALDALMNTVVPGRADDSRRADTKELAATAVLRVDLREVSAKSRAGGPNDEPEDLGLPYWSGVLPVAPAYGTPVPSADLAPGIPVPGYVTAR